MTTLSYGKAWEEGLHPTLGFIITGQESELLSLASPWSSQIERELDLHTLSHRLDSQNSLSVTKSVNLD